MRVLAFLLLAGCSRTLSGPCPEIDAVHPPGEPDQPAVLSSVQTGLLIVDGKDFEVLPNGLDGDPDVPSAHLQLDDLRVNLDVLYVDDTQLELTADPMDPPATPGVYTLVVENPSGCSDKLVGSVEIVQALIDDSIVIEQIIPPFGWEQEDTAVTILGSGFVSTPRAYLSEGNYVFDWELEQVAFIDGGSLTGVVPAGLPVGGPYDLIVENPDQGFNVLEDAFTVTADAPPDILNVNPEAGETQQDTDVTITGSSFDPSAEVWLYDANDTMVQATVNSATPTTIEATFPTSSDLSVGAWVVRVTNPDSTWDDWAAFVVRNPSAKLGTDGAWAESESLNVARVGLGVAGHIDDLGRAWVYAVGGSDGSTPLTSVERAGTDLFGSLAPWQVLGTQLNTPRVNASVFQHDGWVYAVGGDDGSGPVDTVERARILTGDSDVRPEWVDHTVSYGNGTLELGTWYYRVAAVMDASDPENPDGETPASGVRVVRIEQEDGAVDLEWTPVTGAAHYRLYRTDAPNGAAGEEHRIADDIAGTTFLDDGLAAGTEVFVPEGALGEWSILTTPIPSAWAYGAGVLATDPDGDDYLYLVGGSSGAGFISDVWTFDLTAGTWFSAGTLALPRVDNMAVRCGPEQAQNLGAGSPTYLVALEGDDGGGAQNDAVSAPIQAGGMLGGWTGLNAVNAGGQARMDGVGLCAAGHMYILGGGGSSTEAQDSGRQASIDGPALDMGSWSSTSNTGTFAIPKADFDMVQLRATLYAVGGRTDAETATVIVEQVVF